MIWFGFHFCVLNCDTVEDSLFMSTFIHQVTAHLLKSKICCPSSVCSRKWTTPTSSDFLEVAPQKVRIIIHPCRKTIPTAMMVDVLLGTFYIIEARSLLPRLLPVLRLNARWKYCKFLINWYEKRYVPAVRLVWKIKVGLSLNDSVRRKTIDFFLALPNFPHDEINFVF